MPNTTTPFTRYRMPVGFGPAPGPRQKADGTEWTADETGTMRQVILEEVRPDGGSRFHAVRTPAPTLTGLDHKIYALLVTYRLPRTAIADAAAAGTDPDRLNLTVAWQAARDQITSAEGISAADPADLAGTIGCRALAALLPARR